MGSTSESGMTSGGRLSLVAVYLSMAMVVLDAGMLNVALPSLSAAIGVDLAHSIWTVSSYQMSLLVGLLPSAQLAERFGQKTVFVVGLSSFLVASVLCAASSNLLLLIAARVLQGLGGAAIMALGIAILRVELGPKRLARAIGWNALVVAFASAAAPSVAATILSIATWPWLFLAKLPLGLAALVASTGITRIPPTRLRLDATAMILHAVIAVGVMAIFKWLPDQPLLSVAALLAVFALARLMIARPPSVEAPLWPLDLLTGPSFRTSAIASVACFTGQTAGLVALPILLQVGSVMTIGKTALIMTCWPLAVAATAPLSGRLVDRFSAPRLCALGAAMLGLGLMFTALMAAVGRPSQFALSAILCGVGFGLFQVPNNRTLFLAAPAERAAAAGGMQGSARLLGQTFGSLLVGILLAHFPADLASRMALALGALCAAAAALVSLGSRTFAVTGSRP